jgi:hypothetical protein
MILRRTMTKLTSPIQVADAAERATTQIEGELHARADHQIAYAIAKRARTLTVRKRHRHRKQLRQAQGAIAPEPNNRGATRTWASMSATTTPLAGGSARQQAPTPSRASQRPAICLGLRGSKLAYGLLCDAAMKTVQRRHHGPANPSVRRRPASIRAIVDTGSAETFSVKKRLSMVST